jgi:hypothetical protein
MRAARLAVVSATLALSVAAVGASAPLAAPAPTQPALSVPSSGWRALVEQVVRGLRPTTLAKVRVGAPPSGQGTRSVWLYVDLLPRKSGDNPLRGEWEADLVAGALRDLAVARAQPPVAGLTVWRAPAPSGSCCSRVERRLDGFAPGTALDRPPAAAPDRNQLGRRLDQLGVTLDSLTVRRPLGLALEARVTARPGTTPVDVLRARSLIDSPKYDGLLFEARDIDGVLVFTAATSTRVSASSSSPFCYLPCNPVHQTPSPTLPVPLSVQSLLVCGGRDTRPVTDNPAKPFLVCTADRAGGLISQADAVYCTAIVVGGRGHVLTMQVVRNGAVVRASAFAITGKDTWYQTLMAGPPPTGPLECRVLVDGKPAMSRSFEIF